MTATSGLTLAIMQPYLFPYVGYYQLVNAVDRFVISDDVTFIKGGWINRNRLLINGEAAYFTVPLKKAASTTLIKDTEIDDEGQAGWRRRQLKTIANFYRRAPEFDAVFPIVESVFNEPTRFIGHMARESLLRVADYLGVATSFVDSTSYGNVHLKAQDRVIDTCMAESAAVYINAIGGRELYASDAFAAKGITLRFLQSRLVEYRQFRNVFVPWLSMIDVLMFNSRDDVRSMLDCYDLV